MVVEGSAEPAVLHYDDDANTFGCYYEAQVPDGSNPGGSNPRGTVVFVHGGFWRTGRGWETGEPLSLALAGEGWNVWRVQYRTNDDGGGWPTTFDDVSASIVFLSQLRALGHTAGGPVVLVGHSAGGHLVTLACGRVAREHPEADVVGAISLAGVVDLHAGERDNLGSGAVQAFMGAASSQRPDAYLAADPLLNVASDVVVRLVHATDDAVVPLSQSEAYVEAAKAAGQDARLQRIEGDHFTVIETAGPGWIALLAALDDLVSAWSSRAGLDGG